jgi:hypothetical protein
MRQIPREMEEEKIKSTGILSLAVLLSISVLLLISSVHAQSPIFIISQSQSVAGCTSCGYTNTQTSQEYGVNSVSNDNYGDAAGQIPVNNNNYANLMIFFFKTFVYNPSSTTELYLTTSYWVNAYVYSAAGGSIPAWIESGYEVAAGAISQSQNINPNNLIVACGGIPCHIEYDGAGGSDAFCSPCVTTVNNAGYFSNSIPNLYGQCPGQFCPYITGQTYTFVLMFQITSNPGQYVTYNSNGSPGQAAAYVDTGYWGSDNDFTNQNFCLVLSYANDPYYGCPAAPDFSLSANPNSFTIAPGSSSSSSISLNPLNGWPSGYDATLSASGQPSGVTISWSPANQVSSSSPTSMIIKVASSASIGGPYTITVSGSYGSITHTVYVSLTVQYPPPPPPGGGGGGGCAPTPQRSSPTTSMDDSFSSIGLLMANPFTQICGPHICEC